MDGKEIRALRLRLGMSQSEFADKFHVQVGTVSSWELGKSRPKWWTRKELRIALYAQELREAAQNAQKT